MLLTESLKQTNIISDPFPRIICQNILPNEKLESLIKDIPPFNELIEGLPFGNNQRFNYSAANIAFNNKLGLAWKDFFNDHLQQNFFNDLVRLFSKHIEIIYPDFCTKYGDLDKLKTGIRGLDNNNSNTQVLLDVQLALNTPAELSGTTVRGPHIDCPKKLFVGLFYLRLDSDDSKGGDLEIYRAKNNSCNLDQTRTAKKSDMELVETIPYKKNTFVLFLNSPNSYHGVSTRSRTIHPRFFINIVVEMKEALFDPFQKKL